MGKGHCDSVMNILKSHGIHNQSLEDELAQLCETFFNEYELGCYYDDGEEVAEAMGRSEEEIQKLKEENEVLKLCCDDITRCEEAFDKGLLTGELPLSCGVAPDGGDKYVRRQLEKETEDLKEEIQKLKGYLGEVGTLLDNNIVEDNQDPPVTTIFADAFDKLTNNEFV